MLIIASFDGRISMELRHLATFRTLATTLNFTQTAALLGYVQSSVSAQIQELEAEPSYEKQAQVLEKWASKLRKRAMGLRS
jgi:regulatory helix-turn-helix LysR family protein